MIVLYILGLIGLFLVPRFLSALTVALLGYQTLVAMLFVGETRYRVPWDFLIALLAARAVIELGRWVPRTRWHLGSNDSTSATAPTTGTGRSSSSAPTNGQG